MPIFRANRNLWTEYHGCMAKLSTDLLTQNTTAGLAIPFDAEDHDTDAFHDNVTNNSRITIPDLQSTLGKRAKRVTVTGYCTIGSGTATDFMFLQIFKNGALFLPGARAAFEGGTTNPGAVVVANDISVLGDGTEYFDLMLQAESDASITISANRTAFSVKVTDWQ